MERDDEPARERLRSDSTLTRMENGSLALELSSLGEMYFGLEPQPIGGLVHIRGMLLRREGAIAEKLPVRITMRTEEAIALGVALGVEFGLHQYDDSPKSHQASPVRGLRSCRLAQTQLDESPPG